MKLKIADYRNSVSDVIHQRFKDVDVDEVKLYEKLLEFSAMYMCPIPITVIVYMELFGESEYLRESMQSVCDFMRWEII